MRPETNAWVPHPWQVFVFLPGVGRYKPHPAILRTARNARVPHLRRGFIAAKVGKHEPTPAILRTARNATQQLRRHLQLTCHLDPISPQPLRRIQRRIRLANKPPRLGIEVRIIAAHADAHRHHIGHR
jgi:hypothetical protein